MKEGLKVSEWNLASEIFPDDGSRVLVYTEHTMFGKEKYYKRDITIAEYTGGKWKCANYSGNQVIAWMRLPEGPKGV